MAKKNKNQNDNLNNENEKPVLDIITEEEVLQEQTQEVFIDVVVDDVKKVDDNVKEDLQVSNEKDKENKQEAKQETNTENKVKIIDVSKKREEKNKQDLYSKLEGFTSNLGFSNSEEVVEKVFDSLIFLGGGFLASANLATKVISSIAEKVINK